METGDALTSDQTLLTCFISSIRKAPCLEIRPDVYAVRSLKATERKGQETDCSTPTLWNPKSTYIAATHQICHQFYLGRDGILTGNSSGSQLREMAQWLECEFIDRKVTRALVLLSGGMAARYRKGITAERFFLLFQPNLSFIMFSSKRMCCTWLLHASIDTTFEISEYTVQTRSPRVFVIFIYELSPNWKDFDKYTHLRINLVLTGDLLEPI
ncbi:hypothetical protein CSKR_111801 [Clonorchis sinensis]|uniref:Uncharacterized protein n=1 Tax=Clonorchis sinensis TaxID=79923 RepID=A0A3R7FEC5_CLOSI|nr:hypothetical protein CSKR_111801 [Clonorchis sinensis]